jgi:hypothetical protein
MKRLGGQILVNLLRTIDFDLILDFQVPNSRIDIA